MNPTAASRPSTEIIEVSFPLPTAQLEALAQVARLQGMNVGQLLRRVVAQIVRSQKAAERN